MSSAKRVAVVPRSRACARSPVPLPTATSCRQAEVKPNREWKRATPRPRPSRSSTPGLAPCADHTYAVRAAASSPDTTSGVRRTGGRGGASGRSEEVGEGANRRVDARGGAAGDDPAGGAVVTEQSPGWVHGGGGRWRTGGAGRSAGRGLSGDRGRRRRTTPRSRRARGTAAEPMHTCVRIYGGDRSGCHAVSPCGWRDGVGSVSSRPVRGCAPAGPPSAARSVRAPWAGRPRRAPRGRAGVRRSR